MRGKIAIVVMLSVALAAAGFAWSWNYQRSAKAREFWGSRAAAIRFARKVEAFRTELPQNAVDISAAPGLLNARTALMSDDGFDWSTSPVTPPPSSEWTLGVRFIGDDQVVTLLFDQRDRMMVAESGQAIALDPKTAAGWRKYLEKALAN